MIVQAAEVAFFDPGDLESELHMQRLCRKRRAIFDRRRRTL